MVRKGNQFLHVFKMDIEELDYNILKDATHEDLLPTALISKYDATLEKLMHRLRILLDEDYLSLSDGKWIRITEKGKQYVKKKEEEEISEIEEWKSSYTESFFCRSNTVEVNEPYLPSTEGLKKIMEGAGYRETSN